MLKRIIVSFGAWVVAIGVAGAQNPPVIQKGTINRTSPTSGKAMYVEYCAVCHGTDGKGGGPAANALKKRQPI